MEIEMIIRVVYMVCFFVIGTLFGSFFTLATYRLPRKQDIFIKRSYCTSCKHELGFFDLIPVLSYTFLGGKCRYCKEKIRIRYLLLEILTGIIFLLFVMSKDISFIPLNINEIIYITIGIFYIAGIIIIAGIDKEKYKIQKSLILYELIVISLYMVYLYTVDKTNIYRYAIYMFIFFILIIIDNKYLKKNLKNNYTIEILELSMIMTVFTGEIVYITTVIITLLSISIKYILKSLIEKRNKIVKKETSYYKNLPFGFYLICSNIISLIMINFVNM